MNNEVVSPGSVFISSAREDRNRVEPLVKYLSDMGFDIFWWGSHSHIEFGSLEYKSLGDAACVVVVWTLASVGNKSVHHEASTGQTRGILLPVLLDSSATIPVGFTELRYHDLTHWDGKDDIELRHLADRIKSLVARGPSKPRYQETLSNDQWHVNNSVRIVSQLRDLTSQIRSLGDLLVLESASTKDLRGALKEVGNTYCVVQSAILEFIRPVLETGTIDPKPFVEMERGTLRTEIENGRGHCGKILTHYYRYNGLRDLIKDKLVPEKLAEVDGVFDELSTSDGDLFTPLVEIGGLLTHESRAIASYLLAGQKDAARQRILDGRMKLAPLEDKLSDAMQEFQQLQSSLGYAESSINNGPKEENIMSEQYIDLDLHISPNGHVVVNSVEGMATDDISLDTPNTIELALSLIEARQTNAKLLKQVGQAFYDWLFPGRIHTHFHQTEAVARREKNKIRLRLRIEAEEIARLPLEFIYRETGGYFVAINPDTVLSRYLELPLPPEKVRRREGPLHMLAIIADPTDQTRLPPDEWEAIIKEALAKPLKDGEMTLQPVKRATRKEIRNALLKQKPDIIQFVGHGIYKGGKGYLALVDEDTDKTWLVDDEGFANLYLGNHDHLGLISLATCESAKSDDPQGFLGIAPKLVQRGVPAVLSMQYKVLIKTAKIFLEDFYTAIAARKPIDWATQSARNAVSQELGLDNREFATPVLYMRAHDGIVF